MPIYDYKCKSNHMTEARRNVGVEIIPCPICGLPAQRLTVYRTSFVMPQSGSKMRDTYRRFQEASGEIDYTCNQFESETNAKVPSLGLWEDAKRRVANGEHGRI